jgi:hypothetical protein
MTIDPDERAEYIAMAKHNYIAGEFGINRLSAILVMCGFTPTDIGDFIAEHRDAALAAMVERNAPKKARS